MGLRTTSGRPTIRGWIVVAAICAASALAAAWLVGADRGERDAPTEKVLPAAPIPKSPHDESPQQ